VEYTPEMLALIEAQRAYFASDDHLRREVEPWRDASPEERLAAVVEMCAAGDYFLSQLDPETLERVLQPVRLPEDTIEISSAALRARLKPRAGSPGTSRVYAVGLAIAR
jgi:hypothetical protein